MFRLRLSAALLVIFSSIAFSVSAFADDAMNPPKPVNNKVYDAMVGTWVGVGEMMGKKVQDTVDISWALNHQFIFVKLAAKGIDDPNMQYHGLGIFGVDSQNKAKTWWFDDWGADAVSTGSGDFSKNKLTMIDGNPMFKETRSFTIKGKQMIMHAKGSMNWEGKETPFEQTTIYKRK